MVGPGLWAIATGLSRDVRKHAVYASIQLGAIVLNEFNNAHNFVMFCSWFIREAVAHNWRLTASPRERRPV